MSSLEKRLEVFRKLPLRAQLATILSSQANSVLSHDESGIAQQPCRRVSLRRGLLQDSRTKFGISSRQDRDYIASLERIHQDCIAAATLQEREIYQQSATNLKALD